MKKFWRILPILGVMLILASAALLLVPSFLGKQTQSLVQEIEQVLPTRTTGYAGVYSQPDMPALEIQGRDYVGLLELPGYGVTLPVAADWETDRLTVHPCRFWGSAYDGTLVIGGSGDRGQLDFCSKVDIGNQLFFVDLTGMEFAYQVVRVDRSDEAKSEWLMQEEYDLTVFTRDPYSLQYIAVRCNLLLN